jgi:phosphoserine phosphatase
MDGTLLNGRTIMKISETRGFNTKVREILKSDEAACEKSVKIAKLLKCLTVQEFLRIFREIPLQKHADFIIKKLKSKGIKTAIVTDSYDLAAEDLGRRLGIEYIFSNKLITEKNHLTGGIMLNNDTAKPRFKGCKMHSICKGNVLSELCKTLNIAQSETIAIGDSSVDICMLKKAGLGVAFKATGDVRKNADVTSSDLRDLLKYI